MTSESRAMRRAAAGKSCGASSLRKRPGSSAPPPTTRSRALRFDLSDLPAPAPCRAAATHRGMRRGPRHPP
eukprot:scaffold92454_cov48-Phaeocystis_antarctica.AAC.2